MKFFSKFLFFALIVSMIIPIYGSVDVYPSTFVSYGFGDTEFEATLDGAQEVPPNLSTAATGEGTFTYDDATNTLDYSVTFSGMTETVSHIHTGAPGVDGSPFHTLPTGSPKTGNVILSTDQETDLLAGNLYVNIHSAAFPGGEIRGNILALESAPGETVPDIPTELTATAISSTEIELSWTAPADDGGSAITGYNIERECPTGDGFEILVEDTGSTDTTYTDDTLEPDTECNYKVFAINASGISDASNEASATTDAETSDIITFTASGTMAISKTVTKGDFQLEKSKKYNHEISISATIEDCNTKGQIKKFSDITGTLTITNEDLGVEETIELTKMKLTHNSALKKFTWSADQGKGEFNFKSKVNCNEPEGQDGKGSKITKLQADKAKFSSVKVTASDVAFG